MVFEKFVEEITTLWMSHFRLVADAQEKNQIRSESSEKVTVLYPSILLVINCGGYYVAELIGATERFAGLKVKIHKESSVYRYLNQFDERPPQQPYIPLAYDKGAFIGMCLAQGGAFDSVKARFPQIELYESTLWLEGGRGGALGFEDGFVSVALGDCLLVNEWEGIHRCKNIFWTFIFTSKVSRAEILNLFSYLTTPGAPILGVHGATSDRQRLLVGGQLQSLALFPGLRETTIGEFINLHPEVVKIAFKTEHFLYEPYLPWIEHDGTCEDRAINPDLLVRRDDGCYDIYDLKTALLNRKSVTKAGRSRRRFIDYICEGVAQLANYREYFERAGNATLAKDKYGIVVKDPKLVLVVGSWENVDPAEAAQACRMYGDRVVIIDYDTVCHMFLGAKTAGSLTAV